MFESSLLTEIAVRQALESMRQGTELGQTPLTRLLSIRDKMAQTRVNAGYIRPDIVVYDALTQIIEQQYQHLRQLEDLPEPRLQTRQQALRDFQTDYEQGNTELEAWSTLQHRYIYIDLSLQIQELASAVQAKTRHINRRLNHGIQRLTGYISHDEYQLQKRDKQRWLAMRLPPAPYAGWANRDNELTLLQSLLLEPSDAVGIAITGEEGIGKTALVHRVLRQISEQLPFDDVLWLDCDSFTSESEALIEMAHTLGLAAGTSLREHIWALKQFSLRQRCLLILDAVNPNRVDLELLLDVVGTGMVISTSEQAPHPTLNMTRIPLISMEAGPFADMLQFYADAQSLPRPAPEIVEALYKRTKGNPQLGKDFLLQIADMPIDRAIAALQQTKDDGTTFVTEPISAVPMAGVKQFLLDASQRDYAELVGIIAEQMETVKQESGWPQWLAVLRSLPLDKFNKRTKALILLAIGQCEQWLGQHYVALETLKTSVDLFGDVGDFVSQGEALFQLSRSHQLVGTAYEAYEAYQRTASVAQRHGQNALFQKAAYGLIELAIQLGQFDQAQQLLGQFGHGDQKGQMLRGLLTLRQGDAAGAIPTFEAIVDRALEAGDFVEQGRASLRLGVAQFEAGQYAQAHESFDDATELLSPISDVLGYSRAMTNMGNLKAVQTDCQAALPYWQTAAAFQRDMQDFSGLAYTLYNLADCYGQNGASSLARDALQQAYELAQRQSETRLITWIEQHDLFRGQHN